jgi:hypothetical protein
MVWFLDSKPSDVMAALSSKFLNDGDTFGIDGSSSVGVEEVEGFFDFEDFFFSEAWSFEGFGVELFGLGAGFFHKFELSNC